MCMIETGFVEQWCSRSSVSEVAILSVNQQVRLSESPVEEIKDSLFESVEKRALRQEAVCRLLYVPSSHILTAGNQSDDGRSLVVKTNMDYRRTSQDFSIIMDRVEESDTKMDSISSIRDNSQYKSVDKVIIDFSYSMDRFQMFKNPKPMTMLGSVIVK